MSPFQSLPRPIVQKIVHYVTSSSRQLFSGTTIDLNGSPELLIPLLWVCRSFREVVYSRYSKEHELRIGYDGNVSGEWLAWPPGLRKAASPTFDLVSSLTIVVDVQLAFSGRALESLSKSLVDYSFPMAHSLTCVFTWSEEATGLVDVTGGCGFVGLVKGMVPMASEISVHLPSSPKAGVLTSGSQFGELVSGLYRLVPHVSFWSFAPSVILQLGGVRDLVHIDYRVNSADIGDILLVARHSAPTLRQLALGGQYADIGGLVCDDGNGFVEYPNLDTLDLDLQSALCGSRRVATEGILFPSLRRLSICHDYPFGDDTVFRGSAMVLEFLRIMPGADICQVLRDFGIFTPTSHPNVACVKIERLMEDMPHGFESSCAYLQFVLDIAPGAAIRDVGDIPMDDGVFALRLLEPYSCIRVLAVSWLQLELLDVVFLIHTLPALSDLYTASVGLGVLSNDFDKFPDRMCALYRPERVAFRCWHIGCWRVNSDDVLGVLGVALMCPGFSHVALAGSVHGAFMKLMKENIETGGFKRYAPRLRRLHFGRQF
ncbi:hypothetical protein IW152_003234 [Coemansia sp. BCRC 34962]|nr:hypothetical protein IW152_003234 [Coemansia sp. BCRC 34962]